METVNRVGSKLKLLRGDSTQKEISELLGIKQSTWAMYESGKRIPRDEVKVRIAAFFSKSVESIFFN